MSITGSLVGYENNNEIAIIKKTTSSSGLAPSNRSLLNITSTSGGSITKPCPSLNSSISNSIITTASSNLSAGHHQHQQNAKNQNMSNRKNHQKQQHQQLQHQQKSYHQKHLEGHLHGIGGGDGAGGQRSDGQTSVSHLHLNSLWSIWYGILVTLFQGYLAVHGAYRFLGCSLVQWKIEPIVELNIQIVICGVVFILLPLFFASAVFKVGNLANDGIKLGSMAHSRCSISPHDGLEEEAKGGTIRALWTHGGPTAAFVHIIIAMCLLLPRLLLEARIIENGLLPRENIWRNELDFLGSNRERLVVMSFTTSPYQNRTIYGNDTNYYWDDDNSTSNLPQRNVEHVYKFYPKLPVYESEAVEQFAPENSEFMESHENLEMEPMSSSAAPMKLIKHAKIIPTTPKNTPNLSTTSRTTKSIRTEGRRNGNGKSHRKQTHKHKSSEERKSHMKPVDINKSVEFKMEKFDFKTFREKDLSASVEIEGPTAQSPFAKKSSSTTTKASQVIKATSTDPTILRTVSQTISTKASSLPDSDIHIVKPERLPEIIPSTPVTGNSKIIEIKTKKIQKRTVLNDSVDEDAVIVEILPEALIGAIPANLSAYSAIRLDGFSGMLQRFFGIERPIDVTSFSHPPSMEFVNLVLALMVWSIRYPAVFWSTTKSFAAIFSVQMVANTIDIVLCYVGVSTLYKLQIVGQVLPLHTPGLLLNAVVTLSLFILSMILTIASSLILYLYGHGRLAARMRDRCMITMKTSESWIYFAHCASLCLVLALAVVKAPLMHDLSATYRGSLDNAILSAALGSVIHLFLWIVLWLGLTAKRRWTFKLPPLAHYGGASGASQPLLITGRDSHSDSKGLSTTSSTDGVEDTIYWPKMTPNSPKLKVTFNEVTSTCEDVLIIGEHDGKRCTTSGTAICITSITGEVDDGDYATLRGGAVQTSGSMNEMSGNAISGVCAGSGGSATMFHLSEYDELPPPPAQLLPPCNTDCLDDNTSEEGKLLACVRDDSVTYASTRDLEPPQPPIPAQHIEAMQLGSPVDLVSPLAPVTVTVHTNEAHIASSSTPRCLRRADSGVPNEALTPRSDTTSTTESTTSPPERAPSESSSGVHSGEEREEVVIRPRPVIKAVPKPPPPVIQEEPFSRSTNMKMSSFNNENKSSATLPLTRNTPEARIDYSHCSTMPLPMGCHQAQYKPQIYTPTASTKQLMHTTLPNGVRYSNPHLLRRIPHITKAESPYGHLGLGAGHHTFSKLLQDPLHSLASTSIPEDRDSANFSMSSETERECLYANAQHIN